MKAKKEVLKIEQVHIDRTLYPRISVDDETSERYAQIMETGVEFPPIVVAKIKKRYILVDGKHRLDANTLNGEEFIQAEVLENLSEKEIFVESIKRNMSHGRPFSEGDIKEIKETLENFELDIVEISDIIRIPTDKLKPIVAEKMDSHYDEHWESGLTPDEAFKGEEEIVEPIPENRVHSGRKSRKGPVKWKEHRDRKDEERKSKRYTVENFVSVLYMCCRKIEEFIDNLDDYGRLKEKSNKEEVERLLGKISDAKDYLEKVEKDLKKIFKKKKSQRKVETEEEKMNRLIKEERDHLDKERGKH